MPVRVLVVDDSAFFRRRLTEILNNDSHIEVVGTAADGREAIAQVARLKPDVVMMDVEMPVMDGITAVRKIMKATPLPILMFSSLTTDGAKATLDALESGAMDFLPKRMEDISQDRESAKRQLCARVRLIAARGVKKPVLSKHQPKLEVKITPAMRRPNVSRKGQFKLVAIGTSTGGPVALQQVMASLPASFSTPILIVQHMPGTFTPAFAERLNKLSQVNVKEAEDGDRIERGCAYLAPGGKQMLLESRGGAVVIRILESDASQTYKPSVDITFGSASKIYGGSVLAVVMTGMGADGREGARMLKKAGATIWSQNKETSVIYGMPAAIAEAGLADSILSLNDIGPGLVEAV